MAAYAIKFNRTNFLKPITVFRGHYLDITLNYSYDLNGESIDDVTLDTEGLDILGDFAITKSSDPETSIFSVRIRGRFLQENSAGITILINIPSASTSGNWSIYDTLLFNSAKEYFWTGNPIRIPLRSLPTEPVKLWVEKRFNTGEFEQVAAINIADIQDDNGYYIEVDRILHAYLAKDGHRDFDRLFSAENEEQQEYEYSIRRFHIGNAGSYIEATEPTLYNLFTVVNGTRNPAAFFKTGEKWGMPDEVMSWMPRGQKVRIGNEPVLPIPVSIFNTTLNGLIDIPVNNDGTEANVSLKVNAGETVVDVTETTRFSFMLVTKPAGTLIYASRRDFAQLQPIYFLPAVQATHLVATDADVDLPVLRLFSRETNGQLVCREFDAPLYEPTVLTRKLVFTQPFLDENYNWVCTGKAFNNFAVGVAASTISGKHCLIEITSATTNQFITPNIDPAAAITAIIGLDDGEYYFAQDGMGIYFTGDLGATITEVNALSGYNQFLLYRLSYTDFISVAGNASGRNLSVYNGTSVLGAVADGGDSSDPKWHGTFYNGKFYLAQGGNGYTIYTIDGASSAIDVTTGIGQSFDRSYMFVGDGHAGLGLAHVGIDGNSWRTGSEYQPDFFFPAFPKLHYFSKIVEPTGDLFFVEVKIGADTLACRYENTGDYIRNQRYLWFKTRAGTYEFLFLAGEGSILPSVKKVASTRYVDSDSQFAAGENMTAWLNDPKQDLVVNSGWLTRSAYLYYLTELLHTKETYVVENGEYEPVTCQVMKPKPVSDSPDQYFLELNLTKAWNLI